ncbi:MAG: molybdate ABC transporter substrate-binding protein [Hyphomicrobiaceae bacterium]|nr:molybdate ABC transporter substrate-binding protein [Hyphomicrobiaceae bacterium]
MILSRRSALAAAILGLAAALSPVTASAQDAAPLVFAAASLKNALEAVAARWKAETGKSVTFSFAASGPLARQIEQGAPADLFIAADTDWMTYAAERKLIKPASRVEFLGNQLVLVAPSDSKIDVKLARGLDLGAVLGDGRLAIGQPQSVPAGKYAKDALTALGAWDGVSTRLAQVESVRAALALVSRGEASLGIVYATDAKADKGVRIVATFPADSHAPIVYPMAEVAGAATPDATAFLAYLGSPDARDIYAAQGFQLR